MKTLHDHYKRLLKSAEGSLNQFDKVINQEIDIDEKEPEKAKILVQGKMEAIDAYAKTLLRIKEIKDIIDAENTTKGKGKGGSFDGVETLF